MDIGFAISATENDASKTFDNIKETIKYIADTYGKAKLRYGLLVFGSTPAIAVNFADDFVEIDSFKSYLDVQVQRRSGSPDVEKAMVLSKEMFDRGAQSRPGVKQLLVVIMDGRALNRQDVLSKAVMPLEKDNIKVISVIVPPKADEKQLNQIASNKGNIVKQEDKDTPGSLGEKIIDKVIEGENEYQQQNLFIAPFKITRPPLFKI